MPSDAGRVALLAAEPVFSVDGVDYHWSDVLAAAETYKALADMRGRLRAVAEGGSAVDPKDVTVAATAFRYERGLLSAEELDDWLGRWRISVEEWSAYLERSLLLDDSSGGTAPGGPLADDEYVDAVCSGMLERAAQQLADELALAGRPEPVSDGGVDREVAARRLDWTRLDLDALELPDEGAAREAALCVRADGRSLGDVAADCGAQLAQLSVYLEDADPELHPLLLAAQPGELLGPVARDDRFLVLTVRSRTAPSPTDPELRQRAEASLVERALKRASEERIAWHEHS